MSITSSMSIAQQALAVNQAALTVVSNNIANVDTEGYSKLRANQATVVNAYNNPGNSALTEAESLSGVTLSSITRYSNSFLQSYYWDENSTQSYMNEYSTIASNIQDMVNELNDTGLSAALDTFYNAANALSNNPTDITARTNYVSSAQNLCSVFNNMSNNLSSLQDLLVGTEGNTSSSTISSSIDQVNNLFDQLAGVNQGIQQTAAGGTPSPALLDQRDSIVTQLTALIPISTTDNPNGTMNISLGGYTLVDGSDVKKYLGVSNATVAGNLVTTVSLLDSSTGIVTADVTGDITGGSIGAILDACGTDSSKLTISGILSNLNSMATTFAGVMNSIQTSTDYPSGTNTPMSMTADGSQLQVSDPTNYLFVNSDSAVTSAAGITAANIAVNSAIVSDPYLVAAARVTDPTDLTATGNNLNINLQIDLRTNSSYYAGTDLEGSTLEDYLSTMVSNVGSDVSNIDSGLETQTIVLDEITAKLKTETGVNLDEELTDMIKYQRAYQAAARVFSACNSILEELVNLGK